MGVSWYQSASLFSGNQLIAGIGCMQPGGEAWNHFITDKHKEGISDKSRNEVAGYLDSHQVIGSYLTIDVGLRIDRHTVTGTEWVPQVSLSVQLP